MTGRYKGKAGIGVSTGVLVSVLSLLAEPAVAAAPQAAQSQMTRQQTRAEQAI